MVLMEEGGGGGGKVKRIISAIVLEFFIRFFQARNISAHVEVGQKRKLGEHPRGSRLLCSL